MVESDRPTFAAVLNGLAAVKPGGKLTPEALDVWWSALRDWPLPEFRTAAAHLARTVEFMPSPYHFEQLRKAGAPTAGEAWSKATDAIKGKWHSEVTATSMSCGDELIDQAVAMIGNYGAIFRCEADKLGFLERRLCEHFEALHDADEVRRELPQIAGPPGGRRLTHSKAAGLTAIGQILVERKK